MRPFFFSDVTGVGLLGRIDVVCFVHVESMFLVFGLTHGLELGEETGLLVPASLVVFDDLGLALDADEAVARA